MKIQNLSPDTILSNGQIYTLDPAGSIAQAMAIKDSRIVAIGADAEITALASPHTQHINLGGRSAIPGIPASHQPVCKASCRDTDRLGV